MLGTDTAKVVSCHVMIEHVTGSISKNIFFRILPVNQDGLELVTRTKQWQGNLGIVIACHQRLKRRAPKPSMSSYREKCCAHLLKVLKGKYRTCRSKILSRLPILYWYPISSVLTGLRRPALRAHDRSLSARRGQHAFRGTCRSALWKHKVLTIHLVLEPYMFCNEVTSCRLENCRSEDVP